MREKKLTVGITDVLLLILAGVFFAGILTFFQPCGPKADGSWMSCHWAGQALAGVAGAMLVLAAARLFGNSGIRTGIDFALIVMAALAVCIPGRLIALCMMPDMRCHALMTPCVVVLSILTIAASVADIIHQSIKEKRHEI